MKNYINDFHSFINESESQDDLWVIAIDGEPIYVTDIEENTVERLRQLSGLLASGRYQSLYTSSTDYRPGRSKTTPVEITPSDQARIGERISLTKLPPEEISADMADVVTRNLKRYTGLEPGEWITMSKILAKVASKWDVDPSLAKQIADRAREIAQQSIRDTEDKTSLRMTPPWRRSKEYLPTTIPSWWKDDD